ncbi:MAG: TIGR04255 family protein [Methylobacteriaceae bacterium]|nr:TIGR04255 family protein [Methylobacteriaceae bacterium]
MKGKSSNMMKLPTKLGDEPLFDAVFELRFVPAVPAASSVLTGLFFQSLAEKGIVPEIEHLPARELPLAFRNQDPTWKYQPITRLKYADFLINVGDFSIGVGCQMPYAGWSAFRIEILSALKTALGTKLITEIERYSVKYADLIDKIPLDRQLSSINLEINVGGHELSRNIFSLRAEIPQGDMLHIIQIASNVTLLVPYNRTGLLIDVDTIIQWKTSDFQGFLEEAPERLDRIHLENKKMFFKCLREETLRGLEPVYD